MVPVGDTISVGEALDCDSRFAAHGGDRQRLMC